MPDAERLATWFLQLPVVEAVNFNTGGMVEWFEVRLVDGHVRKIENTIRPKMLVEALSFLTVLLVDQLKNVSWLRQDNATLWVQKKKKRRQTSAAKRERQKRVNKRLGVKQVEPPTVETSTPTT